MKGKIIVIEGTDCSGKETQSKKLIERLNNDGIKIEYFSFPNYDSPTGRIIGGPYLGKPHIGEGWFPETAPAVDPKVASLYYAADRRYNINKIQEKLDNGINVILDRYVYSNMGHQASKFNEESKRKEMYEWLEKLEFDMLELPIPDIKLFLYVPYDIALKLKQNRIEKPDQHENDKNHLINAEKSYLEIASIYDFKKIDCFKNDEIRKIEDINDEIYKFVKERLKENNFVKKIK